MQCLLCLVPDQDLKKCIRVDSIQWQEFSLKELIDKYLWCIEPLTLKNCVCYPCWEELNSFHKFYTRIKDAHNAIKLLLKIETDPLQEAIKPEDLLEEILLEPEITIGQQLDTSIVVQQESEEHAVILIDNNNVINENCLDISYEDSNDVIEYNSDVSEGSKNSDSDSDYNLPSISRERKRKSLKETYVSDHSSEAKIKKFSKSTGTLEPSDNTYHNSYHLSKLDRLEFDRFLKEHFKFTCNQCNETFERFRCLIQHYRKEHNEQGYALCCETKFYNRRLLVDHVNYHLNPEYFKCNICGKVYTKRMCLLAHMKMHEGKKHCCDVCDKKFVQKYKLDKHKLIHLPESERKFSCNECGKCYADEYILTRHQRAVHLNLYAKICEICGQTMQDTYTFKRHMEKHNDIPPPTSAKCDICGLVVTCQASLKLHKELKHPVDGKLELNCHICMKVSANMRALKKHIRESHEIGYQYKCTVCAKEFKRSDNFKAHMATHTGTPLYRCPWCPKEFNANGSMHQHRKKAHPIEWEEAQRKKYSGNLPPNYKRQTTKNS